MPRPAGYLGLLPGGGRAEKEKLQDRPNRFGPLHTHQTLIQAAVEEGQPVRVHAHQVQNGGVKMFYRVSVPKLVLK